MAAHWRLEETAVRDRTAAGRQPGQAAEALTNRLGWTRGVAASRDPSRHVIGHGRRTGSLSMDGLG